MKEKLFSIWMVIFSLLIPIGLAVFNHYIGSRLLYLPKGLLGEDFPLESRMYLSKNYTGNSYSLNIHSGLNKVKYSTNELGFRIPYVDYSKEIILMAGDSILFGAGLNDWETVPHILQSEVDLNSKFSFFNVATPGKSIAHHLLDLQNQIKAYKNKNFRIKYLMLWISFNDLEEGIDLQKIQRRAQKKNLNLKDRLTLRFPALAVFYKTLRGRTLGNPIRYVFNSVFIKKKQYRFERILQNEPEQTRRFFSNSRVVKKNLRHLRDLIALCDKHGIVLVNVITAYNYNDIFYQTGFSEYLEDILKGLGQKHIIKLKDIYHANPGIYPNITGRDNDFSHFSFKASQLIASRIGVYLKSIDNR
tara:strand:- start:214 stop:1293 length:1080 start_codon:yes stop_codon:yes gene_type:complete